MQQKLNPFANMIGKRYKSKETNEIGTVTDVTRQPRELVFMNMAKYKKAYHVLIEMPDGNRLALHSGYPMSIFATKFTEVQ